MTVYTGRGDAGETDLWGGERVSKAHPRIESYGTVDELNALLGTVRPVEVEEIDDILRRIQNHLHIVQAQLANPETPSDGTRIEDTHVALLERWIDEFDAELQPLESFILPGGNRGGAKLHHARTVCRRAERRIVSLADTAPIASEVSTYLNRLSDLLFVIARVVNARDGIEEEAPAY